jgi:hypothetical protein
MMTNQGVAALFELGSTLLGAAVPAALAGMQEAVISESGTAVQAAINAGAASVYQKLGASSVVLYEISGALSSPIGPIPALEIACPSYPSGVTDIFSGAPTLQVSAPGGASSIELYSADDLGLGIVADLGSVPVPVGDYSGRVEATGYVPWAGDFQQPLQGGTLNPTLQPMIPFVSDVSGITYIGQFNFQYQYLVSTGPTTPPTTASGSGGFRITMTLQRMSPPVDGVAVFNVVYASVSDPFFGCQLGCTPTPGISVATLPDPPENISSQDGEGIVIFFPNGTSLATENSAGAMHMSSDGRIIGNSLDPTIQPVNTWTINVWDALNTATGQDYEHYSTPAADWDIQFTATHGSWALTESSF